MFYPYYTSIIEITEDGDTDEVFPTETQSASLKPPPAPPPAPPPPPIQSEQNSPFSSRTSSFST